MNNGRKKPYQDLTGQRFGRLVVLSLVDSASGANIPTKWLCRCDCGKIAEVQASNLKFGGTKSCGCLQREKAANRLRTHGQTKTRLYNIWQLMLQRCNKSNAPCYSHYGGRGIRVCEDWTDFKAFSEWAMSNGYCDNLTIDRIDVNGNYCPENCRWVTRDQQQRNKTNNVFVEHNGQTKTVGDWARHFNCSPGSVYKHILLREGRVHGCEMSS